LKGDPAQDRGIDGVRLDEAQSRIRLALWACGIRYHEITMLNAIRSACALALLALPSLVASSAMAASAAAPAKPNIVLIVADDLGYADVGFHGCKDIPTPRLDALAASGVLCTSGYVTHPFCSPTRAALLTGRYQQRFGHENNPRWQPENERVGLPLDQATLADAMRRAGYVTAAVGKWHLGAHPSFHPNRRGFDEYFGLLGGGHHYFDHNQFKTLPAKARQEYLIPLVRNEAPVEEHAYLTDALGREAAAFVERANDKPFFLYLAFNAPHTPLQAPQGYLDRVKDIADAKLRTYGAMVCGMDDAIGRVLDALKNRGLTQNTLVFFISDNGGPTGVTHCRNTPLRGAKGQLYEGGVRVPFLVSWPAKLKPGRFTQPLSSLDIFPTCLSAAGLADAAGASGPARLDGTDLLPHLLAQAQEALADRPLFWRVGGGSLSAVRRGSLKWLKVKEQPPELYDLDADIGELHDLAASKPEQARAMQDLYERWNAGLMPPLWPQP
jgi:arylsulfatase A-like enzyme